MVPSVHALSVTDLFSGITGFFGRITSIFEKENECTPQILNILVEPEKIEPGQIMTITAEIDCAEKVYAYVTHEKGVDEIQMHKISGKWTVEWKEHDLKNEKTYRGWVEAFSGKETTRMSFSYVDPTQSHPASQITAGTFDSGNFVFPQNLEIKNNLTVGSDDLFVDNATGMVGIGTTNPTKKLHVYVSEEEVDHIAVYGYADDPYFGMLCEPTTQYGGYFKGYVFESSSGSTSIGVYAEESIGVKAYTDGTSVPMSYPRAVYAYLNGDNGRAVEGLAISEANTGTRYGGYFVASDGGRFNKYCSICNQRQRIWYAG